MVFLDPYVRNQLLSFWSNRLMMYSSSVGIITVRGVCSAICVMSDALGFSQGVDTEAAVDSCNHCFGQESVARLSNTAGRMV